MKDGGRWPVRKDYDTDEDYEEACKQSKGKKKVKCKFKFNVKYHHENLDFYENHGSFLEIPKLIKLIHLFLELHLN